MVSVVEGRSAVEGETLGGCEPSGTLETKLPGDGEPSNAGTFRDEALDSEPTNWQVETE
jgi:hypothetical protein